jgi:PucR family transcriptional regulator, purine catabolism regulatory protein
VPSAAGCPAPAALAERYADRALMRRLQQAIDGLQSVPGPLTLAVGIGRAESDPTELARSLRTAGQALAAIAPLAARPPVLRFEDLGVHRLLLGGNDAAEHAEFVQQVLGPVLAADARNGRGQLLTTLRALVRHNFAASAAARDLGVHLNTLKYRAQRLRDLFGNDPARGELRLEIELALRIRALAPGAARAGA